MKIDLLELNDRTRSTPPLRVEFYGSRVENFMFDFAEFSYSSLENCISIPWIVILQDLKYHSFLVVKTIQGTVYVLKLF